MGTAVIKLNIVWCFTWSIDQNVYLFEQQVLTSMTTSATNDDGTML